MPWSEIMFAKWTVDCPAHTGSGPVLFRCWSKIQKGNFLHAPPSRSLRSQLSNKTFCKAFGAHLVSQPSQKPRQCTAGHNPAQSEISIRLVDLFNSNFCQTLGHENASKYLSNHGPKVGIKDQLVLLLSSPSTRGILLPGLKEQPAVHLVFATPLTPLADSRPQAAVLWVFRSLTPQFGDQLSQ